MCSRTLLPYHGVLDTCMRNASLTVCVCFGTDRQLLQFSVKEGWEPLCKFLEVPVPDVPFPHTNSTADIKREFDAVNMAGWQLMLMTMLVAGAAVCAAWLLGGKGTAIAVALVEVSYLASCVVKARNVGVGKSKVA